MLKNEKQRTWCWLWRKRESSVTDHTCSYLWLWIRRAIGDQISILGSSGSTSCLCAEGRYQTIQRKPDLGIPNPRKVLIVRTHTVQTRRIATCQQKYLTQQIDIRLKILKRFGTPKVVIFQVLKTKHFSFNLTEIILRVSWLFTLKIKKGYVHWFWVFFSYTIYLNWIQLKIKPVVIFQSKKHRYIPFILHFIMWTFLSCRSMYIGFFSKIFFSPRVLLTLDIWVF